MSRRDLVVGIVVIGACLVVTLGLAQQKPSRFQELMSHAHARSADLDFTELRMQWADQEDYNPYVGNSDLYKETIPALAKEISDKRFHDAVRRCKETTPLYQLDLKWNLRCQEAHEGLGETERAEFHDYMVTGLIRSIAGTGDGKTPETAYWVITLAEEYAVFAVLDVSKKSQELVEIDRSVYDHITVVSESGEERTLYFNIDAIWAWQDRP